MNVKFKDYYKILGVDRNASQDEIQKSYRKLVRKFHPDVNKSAGSEDRFKDIQEAYEVLKDPEKRKKYDALGANWKDGQEFHPPPDWESMFHGFRQGGHRSARASGGFRASDFFDMLFGGLGGFDDLGGFGGAASATGSRGRRSVHVRRAPSVETELEITLEEAVKGGKRRLSLQYPDMTGDAVKTVEVKIPPGVREGSKIRVPGKGVSAGDGAPAGDLLLKVRFHPHPYFKPDKFDLRITVPITPWEAALGAKVNVPTLDGSVRVTVKPGTTSGRKLKIPGKGLKKKDGSRGDLIVELQIVVPAKLSPEEKKLFGELAKKSSFNPRKWD